MIYPTSHANRLPFVTSPLPLLIPLPLSPSSPLLMASFRYALIDPEVGYCQGMNYIAAFIIWRLQKVREQRVPQEGTARG